MQDSEIIERVLAGEHAAYATLVERHQPQILRLLERLVGCRETAQDLAQEAFIAAFRGLKSFQQKSSFSTWLFTIARNKSINAIKKRRIPSTENPPEKPDFSEPSDALTRDELYIELDKALESLSPEHKRAFVLAEFENLSYEQIEQIEGVRIGTVKSRINRAKHRLRSALDGIDGDIQ